MFVKESNKPIITNSMLNQHIENLRYNESSLNAFAKPFIPQNSFTHNNTPHDFVEISNGEHDRGLSSNLISVSQLNNDDCEAKFTKVDCTISKNGVVLAKGVRSNNLYTCKIGDYSNQHIWFASMIDNSTIWHMKLGHANIGVFQNLASNKLVGSLP